MTRLTLAATLAANYGIYGPAFELGENRAVRSGSEEYLDSEKYEIRSRDWNRPGNIKNYLKQLNTIRRQNPALLQTSDLRFLQADNGNVTAFLKESAARDNAVAVAISLAAGRQEFWMHFGGEEVGPPDKRRGVRVIENLVTGERHMLEWGGIRLTIDPANDPALIFRCHA